MWLFTLCAEVLGTLQVIHFLQSILLFTQESLLIIVFSGSADAVEEDASTIGVAEEVDEGQNNSDKGGGSKGRKHADKDAFACRAQAHAVRVYVFRLPGDGLVVGADGPRLAVDDDGARRGRSEI